MTEAEIRHLQREMNAFTRKHPKLGYKDLRVDGVMGRHTKDRIRAIKYELGYVRSKLTVKVGEAFFKRMKHPTAVKPAWGQTKAAVKRGKKRRRHRRIWVIRNSIRAYLKPGVGTFDGVPVAKTAIPVLRWCREIGHNGQKWQGHLVSGYRSPAYSEQLCYRMCGHPTCPGKCAGRNTNHSYATPQRFAIDVSDYVNFGHIVAYCPIAPHIHNALPRDLVHFSPSGN